MYTIKSYKNFWKDFVVERNLTHPKEKIKYNKIEKIEYNILKVF